MIYSSQSTVNGLQKRARLLLRGVFSTVNCQLSTGFTLIETLIAISLLMIAIVAPMSLAEQSLMSAYYARDQITASYLAQEGIEAVRAVRDGNILQEALWNSSSSGSPPDLFAGIPIGGYFTIDAHTNPPTLAACSSNPCSTSESTLRTDGELYGYDSTWTPTNFQRVASATVVRYDSNNIPQEIRVTVTVTWRTGSYQTRSIALSDNFYRWVNTGAAQ